MPEHSPFALPAWPSAPGPCQPLVDKSHGSASAHPAAPVPDSRAGVAAPASAVVELRVRNHPGTMSHITGLFARRGFNLEAIVCVPVGEGRESGMLLLVADEPRLEQVERQLGKLYDVLAVRHRADLTREFFARLALVALGATPRNAG